MSDRVIREPFPIVSVEKSSFKETYGGAEDIVMVFCTLIRTAEPSETCLVTMHPIGGTGWLPVMSQFARAGVHVLACDSRYRGADYALNMEKVTMDLGSAVRHAREVLGYKHVVLLGWSGGGSLSAFYQAQAEHPTVTSSPCGGGPDLTAADLLPADAVVMMAAHVSRHGTLTEWIDPSITDENDPGKRDPSLDIYSGLIMPPYEPHFLVRYREAQVARNRKITAWVKHKLAELWDAGRENEEFAFVTHGTMADPRWLDPSVDPNDRIPGTCYLGDPKVVNNGPVGLARFCTLRSWLRNGVLMMPMPAVHPAWRASASPCWSLGIQPMMPALRVIRMPCSTPWHMNAKQKLRSRVPTITTWGSPNWQPGPLARF